MENITSPTDCKGLIKNTKGIFFKAVILFLIPLLIIGCYTFYTSYDSLNIDYSLIDSFDFNRLLAGDTEAYTQMQEIFSGLISYTESTASVTDTLFDALNYAICILSDTFFILLGIAAYKSEEIKPLGLLGLSVRKCFATVVCCLFSSFVISEAQSLIIGSLLSVAIAPHVNIGGYTVAAAIMLIASVCLSVLVVAWLMLFIYYMNITAVSGRTRTLLSLGYARELLRRRVWKNIFKIMPYIALGILLPIVLNGLALLFCEYTAVGLILSAMSVILQFVVNAITWMYLIPEFFTLEKESGIHEKIKEMIDKFNESQKEN